jgi:hypothetical protein
MNPVMNSVGLLLLGCVLTFVTTYFWFLKNAAVKEKEKIAIGHEQLVAKVADMETRMSLLNQSVLPISTAFQAILIRELTHFHTPEMDALLLKLGPPYALTKPEFARLLVLLQERAVEVDDQISESERDAATMLPYVIKRAHDEAIEAGRATSSVQLTLVTVVRRPVQ